MINRILIVAVLITAVGAAWCPAQAANRVRVVDQSALLPAAVVQYTNALDALGIGYDVYDVRTQGSFTLAVLNDYVDGVVVWCLPKWVASDAEVFAMQAYLANGGNLMLSSGDAFAKCFG